MRNYGACLSIVSIVFLLCLGGVGRAENIFEMIFGGGQHHPQSRGIAGSSPRWNRHSASSRRHFAHKRSDEGAAKADTSSPTPETMKMSYAQAWGGKQGGTAKCCASAAEMIARVTKGDPTLRQGDAFMTSDGLQVFVADRQGDSKFVPVGKAPQLSRALKERLEAMEKKPASTVARVMLARVAPTKSRAELAPGPLATAGAGGKSPARATKDRLIETTDGKTIRLVGGYAN